MSRVKPLRTVVFRLVATLVLSGFAVSVALSILQVHSAESLAQLRLTSDIVLSVRSLQGILGRETAHVTPQEVADVISAVTGTSQIRAVRLTSEAMEPLETGSWSLGPNELCKDWSIPEWSVAKGDEVTFDRLTHVRAPFGYQGQRYGLELLVDGPAARSQIRQRLMGRVETQWLLLAIMTLIGLLLARRWVLSPMTQIMQLVNHSELGAAPFHRLARSRKDEFGLLAETIGDMLVRLEQTSQELGLRDLAFQELYRSAPAAMINLNGQGKILQANRRAAALLGTASEQELRGQAALEFIRAEDRALLRQTIDRLDLHATTRCELRIVSGQKIIDVLVECNGVRDADGMLQSVHLSLLDVSESKELQRQLADNSHLLNLIIDHISAAVLMVDNQGRIAAHNQPLTQLLKHQSRTLTGQPYDSETFWQELGVVNQELFINRLRQIDADHARAAQERFETRAGTFLFQGVPMQDVNGQPIGRLWVVQEITQQEQNQKLLNQQTSQLQALKHLGPQLNDATTLEGLMERASKQLYEVFAVEAMGLAIRRDRGQSRSMQILHRGSGSYLLEPNHALVQSIEQHLMPQILANQDVSLWPELPGNLPWAKAFTRAGLTCLAAGPLQGSADAQGILWIARRGGERLERQHLYLLEALAPVIAGKLEATQLRERLHSAEMTDPVTGLPNSRFFDFEIRKLANRPGYPWAVVLLKLDHFHKINELVDHACADALLATIATEMQNRTRRSCTIVRLSGATFGLISPGSSPEQAAALAERLRAMVTEQTLKLPDGSPLPLTASLGVASCPEDGTTKNAVLDLAASRVELAKRSGRNRVVCQGSAGQKQAG